MALRSDKDALWENLLIAERIKQNVYKDNFTKMYFWRTTQQQEVNWVEEREGRIAGIEFKWQAKKKVRLPKTFVTTYNADSHVISRHNFRVFVFKEQS